VGKMVVKVRHIIPTEERSAKVQVHKVRVSVPRLCPYCNGRCGGTDGNGMWLDCPDCDGSGVMEGEE
jgi:DnaJ-class molecular chaperone